ncbi:hypothetical protein JOE21_001276 [Desmospora profundinema]|uniref:Uncharacterized protein n=1 Tax=Desmospora profundinema TaxID=1571184 RepID=A0ABU1IKI0_9BACL|nr:hypothetical protein [Desmospora profundinema]
MVHKLKSLKGKNVTVMTYGNSLSNGIKGTLQQVEGNQKNGFIIVVTDTMETTVPISQITGVSITV